MVLDFALYRTQTLSFSSLSVQLDVTILFGFLQLFTVLYPQSTPSSDIHLPALGLKKTELSELFVSHAEVSWVWRTEDMSKMIDFPLCFLKHCFYASLKSRTRDL